MKNKIKGITKIYKKQIELSEIDMRLQEDMHIDWFDDHKVKERVEISVKGKGSYEGNTIPIKIKDAINVLQQLNKSGANYVEVMYHSDHCGYVFNGMEIRRSTETEIATHIKKRRLIGIIQKEMDVLKKEFNKKHDSISKLENE